MTIIRRTTRSITTLRPLLAAAVAAAVIAVPSHASAGPCTSRPAGRHNHIRSHSSLRRPHR